MKLKLLVSAMALAAAGMANAAPLYIDADITYSLVTGTNTTRSAGGLITGGVLQYLGNATLADDGNKPTYAYSFTVAAAAAQAGYTFDHVEWYATAAAQAGGWATSTNPAGSYIETLNSNTYVRLGSSLFSNNLLDLTATAGNAVANWLDTNNDAAYTNSTWNLTTTNQSASTTGYANLSNAFTIYGSTQALDQFGSDGNSEAGYVNYGNFAVLARYVYTQDAPPPLVPEPATALLAGLGLVAAVASRRARKA